MNDDMHYDKDSVVIYEVDKERENPFFWFIVKREYKIPNIKRLETFYLEGKNYLLVISKEKLSILDVNDVS